jgi:ABC-type nitrate/sulfonate/bicarbonate transport system ATPase subunit
MLVLDRLGKIYGNGVNALERFSAEIRLGEIVAIIGGSGCGKSTLLRAIAGLDRATTGTVTLDDIVITAPHAKIGIIFQEPRLLPWLSVADNIGFGLSDAPAKIRREKVATALARVGLADKADAWPRELSGGQAQRVAIARALVPQPEVLLLDEPFSALDAFTRRDLQDHLLDLWADSSAHFPKFASSRGNISTRTSESYGHYQKSDSGAAHRSEVPERNLPHAVQGLQIGGTRPTLLLVTHDVDEAVVLADRVLVMRPRPGRLFEEITINLARPRDRNSPLFDNFKRRVMTALDRSLDRDVPDAEPKSNAGEAMWW